MRRTSPSAATVRLIRERDDWRCARCAGWGLLSTQHRVARGMGGTRAASINNPANLLTLCGSGTTGCHGWVEANPAWSQAHGWSVRRGDGPPESVPVWTWRGWVLLDLVGDLMRLQRHTGVPGCRCGCVPVVAPAGVWALAELSPND